MSSPREPAAAAPVGSTPGPTDAGRHATEFGYTPNVLTAMVATCARQRAKDELFVQILRRCFVPGRILEIGAGCGQLSELLIKQGLDVTPSDVAPFLVDYMRGRGLKPLTLDALDLSTGIERPYDNVLSQSISTLITRDEDLIRGTYKSVREALRPGGRFVFILPAGWRERWSDAETHIRIAEAAGFKVVRRFRQQALPSRLYARLPRVVLRAIDATAGRIVGVRWVFVFARK